ncbi:hypothetical protein [Haloglomus halophilum]|uniref:hypothetical protein n=1 Tax=Haloglomus halophilum TaxID=2962672 RepID=UPI0020C9617B|nr:hypothetical protein [Haloglomus halophilum]
MRDRQTTKRSASGRAMTATRRQLLAATGVLAVGSLAGCLGRVASATTNTGASPAAFYGGDTSDIKAGDEALRLFGTTGSDIRYVPATVRGGSGALSGEVDIEGWGTSAVVPAKDLNSSRSNKPRSIWWADPDSDDDGVGDGDDIHLAILDIDLELSGYVESAQAGVEDRSEDDTEIALDAFINATTKALKKGDRLDRCSTDVCGTVRESMERCRQLAGDAGDAVDAENWGEANSLLSDIERIIGGDIGRLEDAIDPEIIEAMAKLRAYLDGNPTIGEQFAVCLPDARLPGDRGSVEAALTPKRLANGLIDEVREDDKVEYEVEAPPEDTGNCGDAEQAGALVLHRDISCRNLLSARLFEQGREKRGVAGFTAGDGVAVAGVPAADDDAEAILSIASGRLDQTTPLLYQGLKKLSDSSGGWGEGTGDDDVAVSSTIVMPVLAQPRGCPSPMPALFYVKRCRHDDQYIYCGGWVIDDGALYQNTLTVLVGEGPTEVIAVSPEEVASDRYSDIVARKSERERSRYGSTMFLGTFDPDADYLPEELLASTGGKKGYDIYIHNKSQTTTSNGADGGGGAVTGTSLVMAVDAPVVHLVTGEGNKVKFKAGAELSKAVN